MGRGLRVFTLGALIGAIVLVVLRSCDRMKVMKKSDVVFSVFLPFGVV